MEYRMKRTDGGVQPSLLGFGALRFPVNSQGQVDEAQVSEMIDRAMKGGVTYYDTAWPYLNGESEPILGRILSKYPRESYCLSTKLPCYELNSKEAAAERFHMQLQRLQTTYFDYYLLHMLNKDTWKKAVSLGMVELMEEYKEKGLIRHFGFSFHDSYEVFEEILNSRNWDFCLIQLNYLDTDFQAGLKGYQLAEQKGIPVQIMEPLKGGLLARLSPEVAEPLLACDPNASMASWGMRWVASLSNVGVVLSGMGAMEQVVDNLNTFQTINPLSEQERMAVEETAKRLRERLKNGCTGCRYCMPCPAGVDIQSSFQVWNNMAIDQDKALTKRNWGAIAPENRPDQCYGCGRCERICPQHLPIRSHLKLVTEQVEAFLNEKNKVEQFIS